MSATVEESAARELVELGKATARLSSLLGVTVAAATARDESVPRVAIAVPLFGSAVITCAGTAAEARREAARFLNTLADVVSQRYAPSGRARGGGVGDRADLPHGADGDRPERRGPTVRKIGG